MQVELMNKMIDTKWMEQLPEYLLKAPMSQLVSYLQDQEGRLVIDSVNMHQDYNLGLISHLEPAFDDQFQQIQDAHEQEQQIVSQTFED